jgi:hypothetical protein
LIYKHSFEFQNQLRERSYSMAAKLEEIDILLEITNWGAIKDSFDLSGKTPFRTLLYSYFKKTLTKIDLFEELFQKIKFKK